MTEVPVEPDAPGPGQSSPRPSRRERLRLFRAHETTRLVGGSAIFFGGRIAGALAAYFTQMFIARWLGKEELGLYVGAFAWCLILSDVALLGLPFAGLKFIGQGLATRRMDVVKGFIRRSRQIGLGLSLLIASVGILVALLLWSSASRGEALVMSLAFACLPVLVLLRHTTSIAHGFSWFGVAAVPHNVIRPVLLLLAVFLFWKAELPFAAHDVMATHIVVMVTVLVGQGLIVMQRLKPRLSGVTPEYETKRWVRTSAPLFLVSIFNNYFPELNVVIVGTLASDGDVAILNAGFRTAFFVAFALNAVDQATLPRISGLFAKSDMAAMQRTLTHMTILKFGAACVGVAGFVVVGRNILNFFGPDFVVGYSALVILALSQLVRATLGPVGQLLGLTGHHDKSLVVCAVSLVSAVVLNILLVPRYGIQGSAMSVFIVTALANLWMHRLFVKHVGVDPSIWSAFKGGS